jgi:5'(3')-deoxyribonucleotidase
LKRIKEIYLDLDDVLNTLVPHVIKRLACVKDADPTSYEWYEKGWTYDIKPAVNSLRDSSGLDEIEGDLWSHVPYEMWESAPQSPYMLWLMRQAVTAVGADNVFICTKPTEYAGCYSGKFDWVNAVLGKPWTRRLITINDKSKLANKRRLLIDDYTPNVVGWRRRKGRAILYPRPWNRLWGPQFDGAEEQVLRCLRRVFPGKTFVSPYKGEA